jgi:hypothetical protein
VTLAGQLKQTSPLSTRLLRQSTYGVRGYPLVCSGQVKPLPELQMTRTLSFIAAFTLVLCAAPQQTQAQVLLEPGTRVRLAGPGLDTLEAVGRIISSSQDSLSFRAEVRPVTRSFAVRDLTSIEVSGGSRTHRGRDALYGLFIGGGAGAILGAAKDPGIGPNLNNSLGFLCDPRCGFPDTRNSKTPDIIAGTFLGGIGGTLAGFIVGSLDKSERWVPLHNAHRFSVHPTAGGLALRMSL